LSETLDFIILQYPSKNAKKKIELDIFIIHYIVIFLEKKDQQISLSKWDEYFQTYQKGPGKLSKKSLPTLDFAGVPTKEFFGFF